MKLILILLFTLTFCQGESTTVKPQPTNREVLNIGLEELDLKGEVYVAILPIPEKLQEHYRFKGGRLDAYITGSGDQYLIRIAKLSPHTQIEVIAHELIHLLQYRSGRMSVDSDATVTWEGKKYRHIENIRYNQRLWEKEAFIEGRKLEHKIREKLKQ